MRQHLKTNWETRGLQSLLCLVVGLLLVLGAIGLSSCTSSETEEQGKEEPKTSTTAAKDDETLKDYEIEYKLRGGKFTEDAPKTVQEGQIIDVADIPIPERKGYTFDGWYTPSKKEASQVKGDKNRKKRILVAHWKAVTYKITFVTMGGVLPDDTKTTYSIESKTIKFESPTRARFEFQGWFTDASMTKQVSGLKSGSTGDRTYFAKWKMIPGDNYFFSQNDKSSSWWSLKYWGGQHIGGSGCGLVAYTMAIDILTGVNMNPEDMYYMRGGEKGSWKGSDATPNSKRGSGVSHKKWSEQNFGVTMKTTESYPSNATLAQGLKKGHVYMIARGGNKCFKDKAGTWHYHAGHYVILYRYDEKTDTFYIHDPSGNTVAQQKLNQAVPYSAKDMQRTIKSRGFTIAEMWVKEGMDVSAEDQRIYEGALAEEKAGN